MTTIEFGQIIIILSVLMLDVMVFILLVSKLHRADKSSPVDSSEKVKYSKEVLDFIKELCTQVAILKFRDFIDTHDISKTTRNNYASVVSATAKEVYDSLITMNINYDALLYSENFLQTYIIDVCSLIIRDSLNKTVDNELSTMNK